MFNSYTIFYDRTIKRWHFNTGDWLIKVFAWAGLTVLVYRNKNGFDYKYFNWNDFFIYEHITF